MNEQNEMAEKVLEYIERSFTDPAFRPTEDEELEIVERFKSPEQYVGVGDVFEVITQFAGALTAKGRESFTPTELQLTLFTLIADVVTDKDVVEVVRCKDCKYHGKAGGVVIDGELVDGSVLDVCHILKSQVENEDFYCAFGTLKDGGESNGRLLEVGHSGGN